MFDFVEEVVKTAVDVVTAPIRVVTEAPELVEDVLRGDADEGARDYLGKLIRPRSNK